MPKAQLILPDGTKVAIEGSTEEVAKLLNTFAQPGMPQPRHANRVRGNAKSSASRQGKIGPSSYILELRNEGFFKNKRNLGDVRKKLEEQGHIYARTTLSPLLIKFVRNKELRRIKDGKHWVYVS